MNKKKLKFKESDNMNKMDVFYAGLQIGEIIGTDQFQVRLRVDNGQFKTLSPVFKTQAGAKTYLKDSLPQLNDQFVVFGRLQNK